MSNTKKSLALHWQILIAITFGVAMGAVLNNNGGEFTTFIVDTFNFGSTVFLRLLKMVVVPLVVTSIYSGITSVAANKNLKKLGIGTAIYYVCTSLLAISTGLLMVNLLKPGVGANIPLGEAAKTGLAAPSSMQDLVTRIIPTNPFNSLANFDMVGIIFFTIVFAVFAMKTDDHHQRRIGDFVDSVYTISLHIVEFVIKLAPIGVFCLVGKLVAKTGFETFIPLSKYLVAVSLALAFHMFITLPIIYKIFTKKSPLAYIKAMSPALLMGFSSASSAATLPLTMRCSEERGGVSGQASNLVLPLGATVNMDGTALYEGVAVLFIAQVMGVELALTQQIVILGTALLVSIGAAGIPHAGLIMMVIILQAVGLPVEATGMIWAVDRVVDMMRTSTNIWSDSVGAAVIDATTSEDVLENLEEVPAT